MPLLDTVIVCLVVGIADGDTLTARCGSKETYREVKIRVAAIDAPERLQPFGEVSRQYLANLCHLQDARIRVRDTDPYGRMVADVECPGQDVGEAQVRAGMAWYYVNYGHGYERLGVLERSARSAGAGLWAAANSVPPWQWRRTKPD